jgi:hypothetical protein
MNLQLDPALLWLPVWHFILSEVGCPLTYCVNYKSIHICILLSTVSGFVAATDIQALPPNSRQMMGSVLSSVRSSPYIELAELCTDLGLASMA